MHADQLQHIRVRHDGEMPKSWAGGPADFQKAKVIAALAWHLTKSPDDPELPSCDLAHQEKLTATVEDIIKGSEPDNTPFAKTAHRLFLETLKPPKEAITDDRQITDGS